MDFATLPERLQACIDVMKYKISFLIEIKLDLCKFIYQIQKMDTHFMTLKYFLKKKNILKNFFETLFLIHSGEWKIRILTLFILNQNRFKACSQEFQNLEDLIKEKYFILIQALKWIRI